MTRRDHDQEPSNGTASEAELVRTVVSLANSRGGSLRVPRALAAREIERLVAEFAAPPVLGIECVPCEGGVEVLVRESEHKPHVFTRPAGPVEREGESEDEGAGEDSGVEPFQDTWSPGQIWVRRGERNVPASSEDLEQMIRERVSDLLSELSGTVRKPGFPLHLTDSEGIAVHLSTEADALEVSADMNRAYPHTATALGMLFEKSTNWAAAAIAVLGLKRDPETWLGIQNLRGTVSVEKYSERAAERIREQLARDAAWNPYAEWRRMREQGRSFRSAASTSMSPRAEGPRPMDPRPVDGGKA